MLTAMAPRMNQISGRRNSKNVFQQNGGSGPRSNDSSAVF